MQRSFPGKTLIFLIDTLRANAFWQTVEEDEPVTRMRYEDFSQRRLHGSTFVSNLKPSLSIERH